MPSVDLTHLGRLPAWPRAQQPTPSNPAVHSDSEALRASLPAAESCTADEAARVQHRFTRLEWKARLPLEVPLRLFHVLVLGLVKRRLIKPMPESAILCRDSRGPSQCEVIGPSWPMRLRGGMMRRNSALHTAHTSAEERPVSKECASLATQRQPKAVCSAARASR